MGASATKQQIQSGQGYHVLQVAPMSPGYMAGLTNFFDFIVSINDIPLNREDARFLDILRASLHKEVRLVVFNSRQENFREVKLTPSDAWGGAGVAGISVRYCSFANANENVWHVLHVHDAGPASKAGLEPGTDYIVGTADTIFQNADEFYAHISSKMGTPVPLFVYSTKTDKVRIVQVIPSASWGGAGTLGCDIAYGYLHRIPAGPTHPVASQEASVVDASTETLTAAQVPAVTQTETPTQPSTSPSTSPSPAQTVPVPSVVPALPDPRPVPVLAEPAPSTPLATPEKKSNFEQEKRITRPEVSTPTASNLSSPQHANIYSYPSTPVYINQMVNQMQQLE